MPWTTFRWKSEVIGKATTAEVLLPQTGRPPFPVFYLLHGLSDDASIWLRHTRIECHVRDLPLVVVMPDGYRGFYTDNAEGPAYARHIGEELPAQIERHFQVKTTRAGRAIGGLSMGGYGALRIGLGYADRFCSVNAHSAAVGWGRIKGKAGFRQAAREREWSPEFAAELQRIFGLAPHGTDHDLLHLAQQAQRRRRLPKLLLDCGTEDFLLEDNRDFHRRMTEAGIPHLYREFSGRHDWDYWELHVQDALRFHAANLGIAR
ncbi:MAG: esterase family protein [Opitutaceae bacterium]|nr:esterase family protein [Opitutaceae bacterium]